MGTHAPEDIGARRKARHAGIDARRAMLCLWIFYGFAALFNGEKIYERLQIMPYGPRRAWALRLAEPLRFLSQHTGMALPRRWVEQWIHGD